MIGPRFLGEISAIGGGLDAISGFKQSEAYEEAGKEAEALAARKAELIKLKTREMVKRMEFAQERELSLSEAKSAASGVGGSTVDIYLSEMERIGQEELKWLKTVGAAEYDIALAEGRTAGAISRSQSEQALWGGIGSMLSGFTGIYEGGITEGWWG